MNERGLAINRSGRAQPPLLCPARCSVDDLLVTGLRCVLGAAVRGRFGRAPDRRNELCLPKGCPRWTLRTFVSPAPVRLDVPTHHTRPLPRTFVLRHSDLPLVGVRHGASPTPTTPTRGSNSFATLNHRSRSILPRAETAARRTRTSL